MKKLIFKNSRGDTIVEVLIALTILSLAMSISYSTVNSSIISLSAARSGARSTALMQQQTELLRTADLSSWVTGSTYCIVSSTAGGTITNTLTSSGNSSCKPGGYAIKISRDASATKYTINTSWSVGSKDYEATMIYVF